MKVWPVQDAKARFSEFLDACLTAGPQMVTRRGAEAAAVLLASDALKLSSKALNQSAMYLLDTNVISELRRPHMAR